MLYGVARVANIEKPSWWRDVIVMYFTPAAFASDTHSRASNFTGLNVVASHSYVPTGSSRCCITHSPWPSRL